MLRNQRFIDFVCGILFCPKNANNKQGWSHKIVSRQRFSLSRSPFFARGLQQSFIPNLSHDHASLRSSLFRFLSGKQESREGSGTEVTKNQWQEGGTIPLFALSPCVRATFPCLSLSPAKRNGKDCYAGYLNAGYQALRLQDDGCSTRKVNGRLNALNQGARVHNCLFTIQIQMK